MVLACRLVRDVVGGSTMQGTGDYTQTQTHADGTPIGNPAQSSWLKDTPWGFRKILNWVKNRWGLQGWPRLPEGLVAV